MKPRPKENKRATFKEKLVIIDEVESGKYTYEQIALKHKCSKQSVSDYWKQRESIRLKALQVGDKAKRCRVKAPKFGDLEERLFGDFWKMREATVNCSGTWLKVLKLG